MPEEALERVLRKAPTILLSGVSLGEGMARAKLLAAWALNGLETWVPKPWVVLGTWVSCRKMQRGMPKAPFCMFLFCRQVVIQPCL